MLLLNAEEKHGTTVYTDHQPQFNATDIEGSLSTEQ